MCTILIGLGTDPRWPVVIAANRDEFYARPSTSPEPLGSAPRIVGGRDLEKGGTWMGATAAGLFVGLTNQRPRGGARQAARSRGEVVLEALRLGRREEVTAWLSRLDPDAYNPFNLLFGDAVELRVAYARPGRPIRIEQVAPGLRVLPNDVLDSPRFPKVERARALSDGRLESLEAALGDTATPTQLPARPALIPPGVHAAVHRLCVRTALYGTVSATSVALAPGRVARYRFAAGAPDVTPFTEVTHLLYGEA